MEITVYGAGTFGFVLARHLGCKFVDNPKYKIWLYGRDHELMEIIRATKTHPVHFPNVTLPENVLATSERDTAINNSQLIILATPAQSVRSAVRDIRKHINQNIIILSAAKGLELRTNLRLSEVINQELAGIKYKYKIAVFSGGTIASEMVMDAALGAEIGCEDYETAKVLQELMSNQHLRVYANTDIIGVEYSGALKNVISIGAGISDGLKNPYGSKTLMISRASAEAKRLALKLGAKEHTFSAESQAWSNDLWMSCIGNTRNRYFGELIGKGYSVDDALKILEKEHKIAEGYPTAQVVHDLAMKHEIEIPVMGKIYEVLYEGKNPIDAMYELMTRQLKFIG
jgi:glycerol-3-phosphate dehydrogenase (NAD(P)+)